jgi:transketolase C-terminal domain/subunit
MAGPVANSGDLVRLNDERSKPREGARADVSVLHVPTIKPLDEATILRAAAAHTGSLVVVVNVS